MHIPTTYHTMSRVLCNGHGSRDFRTDRFHFAELLRVTNTCENDTVHRSTGIRTRHRICSSGKDYRSVSQYERLLLRIVTLNGDASGDLGPIVDDRSNDDSHVYTKRVRESNRFLLRGGTCYVFRENGFILVFCYLYISFIFSQYRNSV
jgi:hypothetical protein